MVHHVDGDPLFPAQSGDFPVQAAVVRGGDNKQLPIYHGGLKGPPQQLQAGDGLDLREQGFGAHRQPGFVGEQLFDLPQGHPPAPHDQAAALGNIHKKGEIGHKGPS